MIPKSILSTIGYSLWNVLRWRNLLSGAILAFGLYGFIGLGQYATCVISHPSDYLTACDPELPFLDKAETFVGQNFE